MKIKASKSQIFIKSINEDLSTTPIVFLHGFTGSSVSWKETRDKLNHEHVASHIINHPKIFAIIDVVSPSELFWPNLGLTLDGEED